jgi:hypothetical protein
MSRLLSAGSGIYDRLRSPLNRPGQAPLTHPGQAGQVQSVLHERGRRLPLAALDKEVLAAARKAGVTLLR